MALNFIDKLPDDASKTLTPYALERAEMDANVGRWAALESFPPTEDGRAEAQRAGVRRRSSARDALAPGLYSFSIRLVKNGDKEEYVLFARRNVEGEPEVD